MRPLIRFTYASGNEPCFVDPDQIVGITPAPAHSPKGCILLMEWGHEIHVAENSEQAHAKLSQKATPAKTDRKQPRRRPRLSRPKD